MHCSQCEKSIDRKNDFYIEDTSGGGARVFCSPGCMNKYNREMGTGYDNYQAWKD